MTLLYMDEMGVRLVILALVSFGLVLWVFTVYRLSKIETKLDRICEALGVEDGEEEVAYRTQRV